MIFVFAAFMWYQKRFLQWAIWELSGFLGGSHLNTSYLNTALLEMWEMLRPHQQEMLNWEYWAVRGNYNGWSNKLNCHHTHPSFYSVSVFLSVSHAANTVTQHVTYILTHTQPSPHPERKLCELSYALTSGLHSLLCLNSVISLASCWNIKKTWQIPNHMKASHTAFLCHILTNSHGHKHFYGSQI